MPKVSFQLDEQVSDQRSNEKAYRLEVENRGASAVELVYLTPRIPDKVELVEVKNPSVSAAKSKYDELCSQLTELAKDQLLMTSKTIRDDYWRIQIQSLREQIGSLPIILRTYLYLFTGQIKKQIERRLLLSRAMFIQINSKADAEIALKSIWGTTQEDDIRKRMFLAKIDQMEALEDLLGSGIEAAALATIEPDSFFAMTYILKFPRSVVEPKKYNIAVEASFREVGKTERHVGGVTAPLIISPRPEFLSLIAVFSALLGVALKMAIEGSGLSVTPSLYATLSTSRTAWEVVGAAVTALVFFNVYEFTAFSQKFKMFVGWRSALLIGVLSGLVGDRIVAALKTFVGG